MNHHSGLKDGPKATLFNAEMFLKIGDGRALLRAVVSFMFIHQRAALVTKNQRSATIIS